jgi:hypothetical protein
LTGLGAREAKIAVGNARTKAVRLIPGGAFG